MTLVTLTCAKCSHTWLPRAPDPAKCPECWQDWRVPYVYRNRHGVHSTMSGVRLRRKLSRKTVPCANTDGRVVSQAVLKAGGTFCNACLAEAAMRAVKSGRLKLPRR